MSTRQEIFICLECNSLLNAFACRKCGHGILKENSVYQFCSDPPMKLEGEDKYIGYDNIGENFEPEVTFWDTNNTERYGVYETCSNIVADYFGNNITVLDLGAGLGTASVPLARNGIFTIADDISNVMLSTIVKRAKGRYDKLICARMNAYSIPMADNTVDVVIENAMLHLVDDPEKVIREIVRVLKEDGCLVRYCSYGLPLSEEEAKQNAYCNDVLNDITDVFYKTLESYGHKSIWFENHFIDILPKYFEKPYNEAAVGFSEVFTEKLKFRLYRLKTGAHSDLQNTPEDLISRAWQEADRYATEKYGDDYIEIKGFSRYGACLDIYRLKPDCK